MERDPVFIKSCKADSVRMRVTVGIWVHLVTMENQVFGFIKENGVGTTDIDSTCGADVIDDGFDTRGVDGVRSFATKTEQNGTISTVTNASQSEGAKEFAPDATDGRQRAGRLEFIHEL
jgi:hypothetical protein